MNNRELFDALGFKGEHDHKVNAALLELKRLREGLQEIAKCGCLLSDTGCVEEGRERLCTPCVAQAILEGV